MEKAFRKRKLTRIAAHKHRKRHLSGRHKTDQRGTMFLSDRYIAENEVVEI